MYDFEGPLVPERISKSTPSYGDSSAVGRRDPQIAAELGMPVSKAASKPIALTPVTAKKAPTIARVGGQPPKRGLLVRNTATGLIDDAKRGGGRAVAGGLSKRFVGLVEDTSPVSKAFGDHKTIDQRERDRRSASRRKTSGVGLGIIGGGTMLESHVLKDIKNESEARRNPMLPRSAQRSASQDAKAVIDPLRRGHKPIWAMEHRNGGMSMGKLPVKARPRVALKRAAARPHGAAYALGAGLLGYGAAKYGVGRGQESYQNARLRSKRRSNLQRSRTSKAAGDLPEAFSTLRHLGASDAVRSARGLRPKNSLVDVESAKLQRRNVIPLKRKQAVPSMNASAIGKAYRSFSAEDRRQRRLGAAGAASGLLGGAALGDAVHRTRKANAPIRQVIRDAEKLEGAGQSKFARNVKGAAAVMHHSTLLPHRAAGEAAAGLGLLAAGKSLMTNKHTKRWQ